MTLLPLEEPLEVPGPFFLAPRTAPPRARFLPDSPPGITTSSSSSSSSTSSSTSSSSSSITSGSASITSPPSSCTAISSSPAMSSAPSGSVQRRARLPPCRAHRSTNLSAPHRTALCSSPSPVMSRLSTGLAPMTSRAAAHCSTAERSVRRQWQSGVRPDESVALGLAPRLRRALTAATLAPEAAYMRGVMPPASRALTSCPSASSRWRTSQALSCSAANMSGVRPSSSWRSHLS
mmetsp:Transcript_10967/g.23668  ORF Transcript_10967/g.23668 Transcript_10967/m.23668 type:complete len:235 (-) Transcript_10967:1661-2365(-)